jgi:hypothetical protein
VTTGIVTGPLTITAPASADLGAAPPGGTIQSNLGLVQVTDGRGFGADWAASVSSSDFSAGGPAETIPVGDATYTIAGLGTSGSATFGHQAQVGLSANPQGVVSATGPGSNTTVTWNPVIEVRVPRGHRRDLLRHGRPLRLLTDAKAAAGQVSQAGLRGSSVGGVFACPVRQSEGGRPY